MQEMAPKNPQELYDWIRVHLGISVPTRRICRHKNHVSPMEALAHSYFAYSPICVWHASRGFGGKSFLLAVLSLTEAITRGANIKLLGGSSEQSRRIYDYFDGSDPNAAGQFWEAANAPRHLHPYSSRATTRLTNGALLSCLAASQTSIRGAHPQRLRIDEADEIPLRLFDAAMGQTMSIRKGAISAQTTISSTWQHPSGTFTEVIRRARERGWPILQWCHLENSEPHGWLPVAEIDRKKHETTAAMWEVEYELCEPIGENRAIDSEAVKDYFDPSLGVYTGDPNEHNPLWLEDPNDTTDYYSGTDWAKDMDWTYVLSYKRVYPDGPDQLVGYTKTGRLPFPVMQAAQERQLRRYAGPSAHDAGGIGNVLHDYSTFYSEPMMMSGRQRIEIFAAYIHAIERRLIKAPRIQAMYEEHLYCLGEGTSVTTGRGNIPIETVRVGDRVMTREGWKPVYHVTNNGNKPTITLSLSNGKTLECTVDHRVSTPGGWVEAGSLQVGSQLTALNSLGLDLTSLAPSLPRAIPAQVVGRVGVPVGALGDRLAGPLLVDNFGNSLQVGGVAAGPIPAQMVDLIGLGDTAVGNQIGDAVSQVASSSVGQPTSSIAEMIGLGIHPAGKVNLGKLHKGDLVKKVLQAPGELLGAGPALPGFAGGTDFAFGTVHVTHISMVGAPRPVWDLGVEDCPEFLAEGVIVHNCDFTQLYGTGHPPDSFIAGALAWYARGGPSALTASFEPLANYVRAAIPAPMNPKKLRTEDFSDAEIIKFGQRGYWTNEMPEPPPLYFSMN